VIRPSQRLAILGVGAFALTVVTAAFGPYPAGGLAAWAAVAAAVIADLLLSPAGGRLTAAVHGPPEAFTGERKHLVIAVGGFGGGVANRLRCRLSYPEGLAGPAEADLAPDEPLRLAVTARRRGVWTIDRLWLDWRSRLGLIEYGREVPVAVRIAVSPDVSRVRSGAVDAAVRAALHGSRPNVLAGEGSDFHQLRDFARGMDPRGIDWKHSARHRSLLAKEMRAERNHSIVFALDGGYLMREEIAGLPRIDHHIAAMLSLAWAGIVAGDRVGLLAFDARPRRFEPPAGGRAAFIRLRAAAAEIEYRGVETNFTIAMAHLHERLRRRSLVVVFSDFVDVTTAELMIENVARLNRQHVVVFAVLRDPALQELAEGTPHSLTDVARAVAARQMIRDRRLVLERLARIGVLVVEADHAALTGRLLSTYLAVKAREVI
jgi:uncharacterized protein (DUF58 family)